MMMPDELRDALNEAFDVAWLDGTGSGTFADAVAPIIDKAITDHHCRCCDDRRAASMALFAAADDLDRRADLIGPNAGLRDVGMRVAYRRSADVLRARADEAT